jgi:hypothetical protein
MTDNLVDRIRLTLIANHETEAAMLMEMRQADLIANLTAEVDALHHRIKCLELEVTSRNAAGMERDAENRHLRQIINDLTDGGEEP